MASVENGSNNVTNAVGRINRLGVLTIDAYGVAVKNGYKGTVEEWLESLKGRDGIDGKDGRDGVNATHEWDGTTLRVTSASGTSSADLKGEPGKDFTYGDFTAEQLESLRGPIGPRGYTGEKGDPGQPGSAGRDGVSPTVSVTDTEAGHRVAVTDLNGTKSFDVLNGQKGDKGDRGEAGYTPVKGVDYFDGEDGKDGTMTFEELTEEQKASLKGKDGVSCTHSWNGTTLSVTSASGTSSADLKGDKGDKGDTGATGPAYTLTDTDKNSIATAVKNSTTPASIGAAPAYSYGTTDLTAGTSSLTTGQMHLVYE